MCKYLRHGLLAVACVSRPILNLALSLGALKVGACGATLWAMRINLLPRALPAVLLAALLSGCGSRGGSAAGGSGSSASSGGSGASGSSKVLTIISPNSNQIQNEFETAFKAKNPGVSIRWIDKGATVEDLRFVQSQFKSKPEGIGIDCFFGGGGETFTELEGQGSLQPLPETYGVPPELNGVPLVGKDRKWVAAALSDFGILYNKVLFARDKLPLPKSWADLGDARLRNRVALADPRHSGSAHAVFEIILQTAGWDAGWKILNRMAANAREFSRSASDLPQSVARGDTVASTAINFYALAAIDSAGKDKLGYISPVGGVVQTPDPIGILKGAPNPELARKWVSFVMSPEGQKLWMLPKGAPGGPKAASLFRQAALPSLYKPIPKNSLVQSDPYASKNSRPYDSAKAAVRRLALDALLGAVLIDDLDAVKASADQPGKLDWVPVSEDQLAKDAAQWEDKVFQTTKTSEWSSAARAHYAQ